MYTEHGTRDTLDIYLVIRNRASRFPNAYLSIHYIEHDKYHKHKCLQP